MLPERDLRVRPHKEPWALNRLLAAMKHDLVQCLRCPDCATTFSLVIAEEDAGQVKTGTLTCASGHTFPIQRFVPRFVDSEKYADTFSRQRLYVRRHLKYYRGDRSGYALFERTTGLTDRLLAAGVTLEIGCGYGRFLDVVNSKGGRVVGVDLSTHSVDLAQDFVGHRPGVDIVQADLFKLPFSRNWFDQVYSIGVLHHTPDTSRAFEAITPFARPGGRVSIWVYPPEDKYSTNRMRRVTARMDHRLLYALCIVNQVGFSWIRALPGGWRFNRLIDGTVPAKGRPFWIRVLSDFDNLSPTYAHVHTPQEVVDWFAGMGFRDIRVLDRRTAVTGSRGDTA